MSIDGMVSQWAISAKTDGKGVQTGPKTTTKNINHTGWVEVTYDNPVTVSKTILAPYGTRIGGFLIEYSNDNGTTWLPAFERLTSAGNLAGVTTTADDPKPLFDFTFPAQTAAKFRVRVTGGASGGASIWEWELYNE